MSRPWPLRLAAREGLATARAGQWTSLLVVCAVAWMGALPGATDAVGVSRLVRGEREWIDAGAHVYRVQGAEHDGQRNPVPAAACDALARLGGIDAAFWATRDASSAHLTHVPGGEFSLIHVSPAALGFLGVATPVSSVVLVTAGLARRTGLADGSPVRIAMRASITVAPVATDLQSTRVVAATQLGSDYDGVLLMPSGPRPTADSCFVRTDAAHVGAVGQLLPSALGWGGQDAVVSPLLAEGQFAVDYATAYPARDLRWAWAGTAVAVAVLWGLVQWFRRSHTAIYATFGMRRSSRVVMELAEWSCLAVLGAAWGWALGVIGSLAASAEPEQALLQVSAHVASTVAAAGVLVVVIALRPTGSLLDGLKDR